MSKQKKKQKKVFADQELTAFRSLLKQHNVYPKKRLGQTFLYKGIIADDIVRRARISSGDVVVEIGPGLGALTFALAEKGVPVIFTGHDLSLQGAVDLIRQGACDFLDKPFPQGRLVDLLNEMASGHNT